MSRPRHIEQDDILDAAEAVILRDGVARLTLDAVAQEANISKASVIYDHKTKKQLIHAVVARQLQRDREKLTLQIEKLGGGADAPLLGVLDLSRDKIDEKERTIALNLCAGLAQDGEVLEMVKAFYRDLISEVEEGASRSRTSLMAFLAIEGLRNIEWYDFHCWDPAIRAQLLSDIAGLIAGKLPDEGGGA